MGDYSYLDEGAKGFRIHAAGCPAFIQHVPCLNLGTKRFPCQRLNLTTCEAGETALLAAVRQSRMLAVCLLLLERHIDVNGHDSKGDSPLLLAIRNGSLGAQSYSGLKPV